MMIKQGSSDRKAKILVYKAESKKFVPQPEVPTEVCECGGSLINEVLGLVCQKCGAVHPSKEK